MKKEQEQQIEKIQHELLIASQTKQKKEEEREGIQRNIQDFSHLLGEINGTKKALEEQNHKYQHELELRLRYMQYLTLLEEKRFDKEYICLKFDEKTDSLKEILKKQEREIEKLETELEKMKHGIVFEIPKEVEEHLHGLDVNFVTGMEYLKFNGYSKEENDSLLNKIPILPYSMIMSERELNKLSKAEVNFFTSYPIPILIKEELNQFQGRNDSTIYHENKLNFFVAFNKQLLNEKELEKIILQRETQVRKGKDHIEKRKGEIRFYDDMRQEIAYQECKEENYIKLQQQIEDSNAEKDNIENQLLKLREEKKNNDNLIETLQSQCKNLENSKKFLADMYDGLLNLEGKYKQYLVNLEQNTLMKQRVTNFSREIEEYKKEIAILYEKVSEKRLQISDLELKFKEVSLKNIKYASYKEGTIIYKDLVDIETRYEAITDNMNYDVKLMEEQIDSARSRFVKIQDQLIQYASVNNINENEYKESRYSPFKEKELEQQAADYEKQVEALKKQWYALDKEIGILESKIQERRLELQKKYNQEEPVLKEEIIDIKFVERIKLLKHSIGEEEKNQKELAGKRYGYEANISALSEFSDLRFHKEFEFMNDLAQLKRHELEEFHGILVRDYRSLKNMLDKQRLALERAIEALMAKEKYRDDFYIQPLSLMRQLTDKPEDLLKQLDITLQSYETLLQKLEVDIAFIEREKDKIVEMLFDYVQEIYKNLDKIDRNSTINVKERSIKMLKVQVPAWDENKEIYKQRMSTFTEELITVGLQCIDDNHNLDEMIGVRVTSKALYDSVIGIGTTIIKLYKIEAQREYPITWAQVSKNSGGEGFLSAFVVLSSLLSYMRRDESDLFINREEGKVLVMDNPFAQTNASHLLIPLMDFAKKCNTQLICLTGLGGESIYNRFDNIYVLNLIESGLQRDVRYLKADHVKGDTKVYQMSTTRMKLEESEQMELIF